MGIGEKWAVEKLVTEEGMEGEGCEADWEGGSTD